MRKRKHHPQWVEASLPPEWLLAAVDAAQLGAWILEFKDGKPKLSRTSLGDEMVGDRSHVHSIEQSRLQIYPEDQPRISNILEDMATGRIDSFNIEFRFHKEDGSIRWINSWGKRVHTSDRKSVRLAGVSRDITETKNLQLDREQFVATLSHDLKNPLSAAKIIVDLILRFPNHLEGREKLLNKVTANILRADKMIQDLLDATQIRSGQKYNLNYEDGDLAEVLHSKGNELSTQHGDRFHIQIDGDFHGTWAIEGLRRAIENLADNAIKYGANNTLITVALSRTTDVVTLSVHNEGEPISSEEQKSLFEPFKRTKEAEKKGKKGWGLGLTIVRGVAETLGGRVEVRSAPEIGTTFSLVFPGKFAGAQKREVRLAA
jgi:signal transduction histidine kinase